MLQSKCVGNRRNFDCDISAAWKRIPKCILCNNEFSSFCRRSQVNRRPMILDCIHNVCESCVFATRPFSVHCKICNVTTSKNHRELLVRSKFEYNYYLYGLISYMEITLPNDLTHTLGGTKTVDVNGRNMCEECNTKKTNFFCVQCGIPYCKNCFNIIHQFGKALQKHSLKSLEQNSDIINEKDFKKCYKHNRLIDQYCSRCNQSHCTICKIEFHKNHIVHSINDQNKKYIPKLHSLIETLKIAKENNREAQK